MNILILNNIQNNIEFSSYIQSVLAYLFNELITTDRKL